jgi:hypothetical protein
MATPDIPFDNLDEYIPVDGFPHTPRNMDCPCYPDLVIVPHIGAGIIHRRMSIADTFPEEWNE